LYNSPLCDESSGKYYGCKNFKMNGYLQVFYGILCVYLLLSALQIRHGLPTHKVPSSIMAGEGPLGLIKAQIF
jgi:hypothetical protein